MKSVANIPRPVTVTATKKLQKTISYRIHMIEPRCLIKYRSLSHFARNRCEQVHIAALNFAPLDCGASSHPIKTSPRQMAKPSSIDRRTFAIRRPTTILSLVDSPTVRFARRHDTWFTSPGVPAGSFSGHGSRLGSAKGNRLVRPGGSLGAVTARAISRWQGPCRRHLGTGRRCGRRADLCPAGSG